MSLEELWYRATILDEIHLLAQTIVRSPQFEPVSLQPTSSTPYDHCYQRALLLYRESDYVERDQFTVLGRVPGAVHRRRDLGFCLATDGRIYYGYLKPYRPVTLATWSVRQLQLLSSLPPTRVIWVHDKLCKLAGV